VEIEIPPLRERRTDIPILAHHFLDSASQRMGRRMQGFTNAAMDRLVAYPWSGNVRELENEIERTVALAGDAETVGDEMLSEHIRGANPMPVLGADDGLSGMPLNPAVDALKRRLIQDALREAFPVSRSRR
jgi:DNA-binding NtrC family response regulator